MEKKTKDELQIRYREIQDRMGELNVTAAEGKRALTSEEQREWDALTREAQLVMIDLQGQMNDAEMAKHREQVNKGEMLREYFGTLSRFRICASEFRILNSPTSPYSSVRSTTFWKASTARVTVRSILTSRTAAA
jgi:hypothetical protein